MLYRVLVELAYYGIYLHKVKSTPVGSTVEFVYLKTWKYYSLKAVAKNTVISFYDVFLNMWGENSSMWMKRSRASHGRVVNNLNNARLGNMAALPVKNLCVRKNIAIE